MMAGGGPDDDLFAASGQINNLQRFPRTNSATASRPQQQPPQRRWQSNAAAASMMRRGAPVETPERPLLTDFASSPVSVGTAATPGSQQHIYMEVMDPWRNDFYQTPAESGYERVFAS